MYVQNLPVMKCLLQIPVCLLGCQLFLRTIATPFSLDPLCISRETVEVETRFFANIVCTANNTTVVHQLWLLLHEDIWSKTQILLLFHSCFHGVYTVTLQCYHSPINKCMKTFCAFSCALSSFSCGRNVYPYGKVCVGLWLGCIPIDYLF